MSELDAAQARYDAAKAAWVDATNCLGVAKRALLDARKTVPPAPRALLGPNARLRGDAVDARNQAMIARYQGGMSIIGIAKEFGLAKGTVSSNITWGLRKQDEAAKQARWRVKYPVDPPLNEPNVDLTDAPIEYQLERAGRMYYR